MDRRQRAERTARQMAAAYGADIRAIVVESQGGSVDWEVVAFVDGRAVALSLAGCECTLDFMAEDADYGAPLADLVAYAIEPAPSASTPIEWREAE